MRLSRAIVPAPTLPAAAIEASFARAGLRVLDRVATDGRGGAAPAEGGGELVVDVFARPLPGTGLDLTVLELAPTWHRELLRALSTTTGGFVAGVDFSSTISRQALALFHAGRTVPLAPAPADVLASFRDLYRDLCRAPLDLLEPDAATAGHRYRLAVDPATVDAVADEGGVPLSRVLFDNVDGDAVAGLLDDPAIGWPLPTTGALFAAETPTGLPYVILEHAGPLPADAVTALARRLGCCAGAIELGDPRRPVPWLAVTDAGQTRAGASWGQDAIAGAFGLVLAVLGEPPAMLARPSGG